MSEEKPLEKPNLITTYITSWIILIIVLIFGIGSLVLVSIIWDVIIKPLLVTQILPHINTVYRISQQQASDNPLYFIITVVLVIIFILYPLILYVEETDEYKAQEIRRRKYQ